MPAQRYPLITLGVDTPTPLRILDAYCPRESFAECEPGDRLQLDADGPFATYGLAVGTTCTLEIRSSAVDVLSVRVELEDASIGGITARMLEPCKSCKVGF